MSSDAPTVSVLLTAYNEEEYIADAIDSILKQTYSDWELIIIDDGSTDETLSIVSDYAEDDHRIRMFCSDHIGRSRALNKALNAARGDLVAIQDADDVSIPERLERQVASFDSNPNLRIVGGHVRFNDLKTGKTWEHEVPITDREIRTQAPKHMPFNHTTIMFRSPPGGLRYPIGDLHKDYVFCSQLLVTGRAKNLDTILATVRRHEGSITQSDQRQNYQRTARTQLLVALLTQSVPRGILAAVFTILKWVRYEFQAALRIQNE